MQDGTLVFLLRGNPPTEILLGFKKNGFGQGKFNGFGGKIEPNESIESAAARELEEECGVEVAIADLQHVARLDFVFPAKPEWDQIVHAFVAYQWRGEPIETRETPALACGASVKPIWFKTNAIPYDKMSQTSRHLRCGRTIFTGSPSFYKADASRRRLALKTTTRR